MNNFCLIGYPLGHSMSPIIHSQLFKIKNIDASYNLNEIAPENLKNEYKKLKTLDGFNVTIPHKTGIIPMLDGLSQRAQLFGAVNTVKIENGKATGHNTDCFGFLRALEMAEINLGGKVLLCGSGGVSRMFAFESILAGADLTIAVRDSSMPAANLIKSEIKDKLDKQVKVVKLGDVEGEFDLLINGTPVGMFPKVDASVLPKEKVQKCKAVFVLFITAGNIDFKICKEAGIKHSNGLSMLVWQAAVAQEIWFDTEFTKDDIKKVLKVTQEEMEKI